MLINFNSILPIFVLVIVHFTLRFYLGNQVRHFRRFSEDQANEYTMVKTIKMNDHKFPYRYDQYFFGDSLYPVFFQWICSFLPYGLFEKKSHWLIYLIDFIHSFLVYIIALALFDNIAMSFLASIIFTTSPVWTLWDNRTFSFSSRAVGALFYSLSILYSIFYFKFGDNNLLVLAVIFVSLTLITHRFATQTLVFTLVLLSIIYSVNFLIILFFGFIFAIIFSWGHYLDVLRGHIGAFYFFKLFDGRYGGKEKLVGKSEFRRLIEALLNPIKNNLRKNYFIKNLKMNPLLLFVIIPFSNPKNMIEIFQSSNLNDLFFVWSLIPLFCMFATSFRSTRFAGSPERYLEYGIFPLSIVSVNIIHINQNLWKFNDYVLPNIYHLSVFLLLFSTLYYNYKKSISKHPLAENYVNRAASFDNLFQFMNTLEKGLVISIRINLLHNIVLHTKHNVLYYLGANTIEMADEFSKIMTKFPLPDLDYVLKNYDLDYLVIDKDYCNKLGVDVLTKNSRNFAELYDDSFYKVYVVSKI